MFVSFNCLKGIHQELSLAALPTSLRPRVLGLGRGGGQNPPPPPSGARSAKYPSGARVKPGISLKQTEISSRNLADTSEHYFHTCWQRKWPMLPYVGRKRRQSDGMSGRFRWTIIACGNSCHGPVFQLQHCFLYHKTQNKRGYQTAIADFWHNDNFKKKSAVLILFLISITFPKKKTSIR